MQVVSIISTKGGVGKTTTAANLGGFAADAGLRVLLLDLDVQPTLSSYYELVHRAPAGIYELLAFNERDLGQLVSRTIIRGLDLVLSNDDRGELNTWLLHAPDGRLRLRHLLPALAPFYDLMLIDTQGARSVLLEMAVLASDTALSPVTPEILAARELRRGTLQLIEDIAPFRHLGIEPPPLRLLINRVHPVSANARLIQQTLRLMFQEQGGVQVLETDVPAIEAYPRAATRGLPVHRVEYRQPTGRSAPAALTTIKMLACELFPQWRDRFERVTGRVAGRAGGEDHGTVPYSHDVNPYIATLAAQGSMVLVGYPGLLDEKLNTGPMLFRGRSLGTSLAGGMAEHQEMLDFCGEHGITSDIEVIDIKDINAAYARVLKSDVKYRFVIDMATL